VFNIEKFYSDAHDGETVDLEALCEYVKSFEHIFIWGAGNLGTAIGAKLIKMQVPVTAYWDIRTKDIKTLHGISVIEPFSGNFPNETTLIIFCITNVFIVSTLRKQLADSGYKYCLIGESLYEALICPLDKNTALDIRLCRDLPICNVCTCKRLDKLIQKHNAVRNIDQNDETLHFPNITFVINQKCTLSCKYCYSYLNNYPVEKRVNFPVERVKKDIDRFFDAVDSVTLVPVIGGEPFLHPDIGPIVKKFLEKSNLGILNVTTNGICDINPECLENFRDDRARIFFSNYLDCLSEKQKDIFQNNIDFVKSQGVCAVVYNTTPQWTVPVTLSNKGHSIDTIAGMKRNCMANPTNGKYVKNGRFYPCTIIDSVHSLDVAHYSTDFVDIDETGSAMELRNEIRRVMDLPYYQTCRHCGDRGKLTEKAGVQGHIDYITAL